MATGDVVMDSTTPRIDPETDSALEREPATFPMSAAELTEPEPEPDGVVGSMPVEPAGPVDGDAAGEPEASVAEERSDDQVAPDTAELAEALPQDPSAGSASELAEPEPSPKASVVPIDHAEIEQVEIAENAEIAEPAASGEVGEISAAIEVVALADPVATEPDAIPDSVATEPDAPLTQDVETATSVEAPVEPPSSQDFEAPSNEPVLADGAVPGAEWATIDDEGNVRQRDGDLYTGRVIGRITGHNPALALAFYARQFDQFAGEAQALEDEARAAGNPAAYFGRIRRTLEQIPTVDGIGDFDGLIRRLHALEGDLRTELDRRRAAKERLAARAEELAVSTDWKATGDELRAMFEEWKGVGTVGRDHEQALWERFNTARQAFYTHREIYFAERERERQANLAKKEDLCERAEALQDSTEWKATGDALKGLQTEWKATGTAGREQDQALWSRFRGAMDVFFESRAARFESNKQAKRDLCAAAEALQDSTEWSAASATLKGLQEQWKQVGFAGGEEDDALWARFRRALDAFYARRSEVFAERDRAYGDNLRQKEALIAEAEELLAAGDLRNGTQRVKALQEQWKAIGPVPRERAEPTWQRFRAACDAIFNGAREERERRQNLWRSNLKESLERQRAFAKELMEAIARDDELLDRWKGQLETLRPGGREPEIRQDLETKITAAEARIQQKQRRFEEILTSIAELEGRLALETAR
jgi:hypothetical protein